MLQEQFNAQTHENKTCIITYTRIHKYTYTIINTSIKTSINTHKTNTLNSTNSINSK